MYFFYLGFLVVSGLLFVFDLLVVFKECFVIFFLVLRGLVKFFLMVLLYLFRVGCLVFMSSIDILFFEAY